MIRCYYHNDLDGKCAAAIVAEYYRRNNMIAPEFIPVDYGLDTGIEYQSFCTSIIMLDFSLQPIERMQLLADNCEELIWIDHHASVKNSLDEYFFRGGIINYNGLVAGGPLAACELTWYCFNPSVGSDRPEAVRLLGTYDTWRYKGKDDEEDVLNFQYGMRSYPNGPKDPVWEGLIPRTFSHRLTSIMERGKVIRQYENLKNADRLNGVAHVVVFNDLKFLAANTQSKGSLQFQPQWPDEYDAMMVYCYQKDHWRINMYTNKPGINLANIAKCYGGGGHVKAAGFQLHYSDILEFFDNNQ